MVRDGLGAGGETWRKHRRRCSIGAEVFKFARTVITSLKHTAIKLVPSRPLPEYQRRGVGSAVIKDVNREATEQELPVTLGVLKVNPRAQALYEKLGFVVNGETETHILMKLGS